MAGIPSQAGRRGRPAARWRSVAAGWLALRMQAWAKALARLASSWDLGQGIGNESAPLDAFPGPDGAEVFSTEVVVPHAVPNNDSASARNRPPSHWLEYVRERSPSLYGAIQSRSTEGAAPPMDNPARTGNALSDSMAGVPSQDLASLRPSAVSRIEPPVLGAPGEPISRLPRETTAQATPANEAWVDARESPSTQPPMTSAATEPVRDSSRPGVMRSEPQAKAGASEHSAVRPTMHQAADQSPASRADASPPEGAMYAKPSSPSPHRIMLRLGGARSRPLPSLHLPDSEADDPAVRGSFVSEPHVSTALPQIRALEQPLGVNLAEHDVESSSEPTPSRRQDRVVVNGESSRGQGLSTEPTPALRRVAQSQYTRDVERPMLAREEQVAASRRGQYSGLEPEIERQSGLGGELKSRAPISPRSTRVAGAPTEQAAAGTDLRAHTWPSVAQVPESEEPVADPWPTLSEADPLADRWDEEDAAHQRALHTHERRLRLDREQRGVLWNE